MNDAVSLSADEADDLRQAALDADSPYNLSESGVRERMGPIADKLPMIPAKWLILVEMVPPRAKTEGGIYLPDEVQAADEHSTCLGRVVAKGYHADNATTRAGQDLSEDPNNAQIGDFVLINQYVGQKVNTRDGRKYKVLVDTTYLGPVPDPDFIEGYSR